MGKASCSQKTREALEWIQLQLLVELEALKRLKATYFYHIDHKNRDEWIALFTPDASLAWDGTVSTLGREKLQGGTSATRRFASS